MVAKIISGGQTGVDRAALDFAIEHGISHGGFCPHGRQAEDGRIPDRYHLIETESEDYAVRTEKNVDISDGTLILYPDKMSGGTLLTYELCQAKRKPVFLVDLDQPAPETRSVVVAWLKANNIHQLNVAGPRGSQSPTIYNKAKAFLQTLFARSPNP